MLFGFICFSIDKQKFGVLLWCASDKVYETSTTHDVAVTNVTVCYGATIIHEGATTCIGVTVANEGDFPETFNVTVYWNTTEIQTMQFILPNGTGTSRCFSWNTTGLTKYLNYTIRVYAHPVSGETDLADNTFTYGNIILVYTGDTDANQKPNVKDIFRVAKLFGSEYSKPGYNPNVDINCDGKINVKDMFAVAKAFSRPWI
jgi:hypothetical protein